MVGFSIAGQGKTENDSILSEWQSDISTYGKPIKKGPRVTDYDKQKGRFKGSQASAIRLVLVLRYCKAQYLIRQLCLSVCLSVCSSVTCFKTTKPIVITFQRV